MCCPFGATTRTTTPPPTCWYVHTAQIVRLLVSTAWLSPCNNTSYLLQANSQDDDNPSNLLLNDVLEHHVGIPISLALLHMAVGQRAGLQVGWRYPFWGSGAVGDRV